MGKKISDYEKGVLIDKYLKRGLSQLEAEKEVNNHIKLMVFSPLTMIF